MSVLLYSTYSPFLRRYHVVYVYIYTRTLNNDSVTHHFSPQEKLGKISLIYNMFMNRRLIWDIKWVNPKLGVMWNYHIGASYPYPPPPHPTPQFQATHETKGGSLKLGSN